MMRNYLYTVSVILLMSIALQSKSNSLVDENIELRESLSLSLDRNLYCVEEMVHFRIFNTSDAEIKNEGWSKVVNVEIITPEGKRVIKGKYAFTANGASGSLFLPRTILSGNYYIRAYTKWMRNKTVYDYFYERIKIVNPFNDKILLPSVPIEKATYLHADSLVAKNVSIKIDKTHFETNSFSLIEVTSNTKNKLNDFTISVVKTGTINSSELKFDNNEITTNEITFIPELRGVSVSGTVIDKADSSFIPFATVWITLQNSKMLTREVMCDNFGHFTIDLGNEYGEHNLFVSAKSTKKGVTPILKIENDFAYSVMSLPYIPFEISENEKPLITNLMVSSQLNRSYYPMTFTDDSAKIIPEKYFYGNPDFILKLSDYISLPTINDYIKELLPQVRIKKDGNIKSFHVLGNYPELYIYEPLVLVDLVRISNVDEVLKMSPENIDRIEIVQIPYLRGDINYGGIIHFVSKEGDFANIDFPDESVFVTYSLLDSTKEESLVKEINPTIPFIGNCLYWNGSMHFNENNKAEVRFKTGNEPGNYQLKIEGIDNSGMPFIYTEDIFIE